MIWVQGAICMVLWVGFGFWSSRKALLANLEKKPWAGIGLMILGASFMFGGMATMAMNGGMVDGKLTGLGWVSAAVLGMIFCGAQSYGAVWVLRSVIGSETRDNTDTSKNEDSQK
ncbi:MAG: hypothetical protein ACKVQS_13515 [Fimbriimonadaceae bacterium]